MNPMIPIMIIDMAIGICIYLIIAAALSAIFEGALFVRQVPISGSAHGDEYFWPAKMQVRLSNFFCTIYSPNLNLSDDQLIDAWKLPPQTRLSSTMKDIARCQVAKWILINKGEWHEERKCLCIEIWWLLVVVSVAVAAYISYGMFYFYLRPVSESHTSFSLDELYVGRCCSGIWFAIWSMILWMCSRNHDARISFTSYGAMNPHSYYKVPTNWSVLYIFCMITCILEGINFLIYTIAISKFKFKPQEVESRANGQSPPSDNRVLSLETKVVHV